MRENNLAVEMYSAYTCLYLDLFFPHLKKQTSRIGKPHENSERPTFVINERQFRDLKMLHFF